MIKVKEKKSKSKGEKPFPKLMVGARNQIVLMSKHGEGVSMNDVRGGFSSGLGHYSSGWIMANFSDYEGKLILENE